MTEEQAPTGLPHAETITLDLVDGFMGYTEAMEAALNRIVATGYPGNPRDTANTMIFEVFNYLEGLLPGIDVREVAAFYGAVVGLGVGGHIASGELGDEFADYIAAVFYSAMRTTIPMAIQMHAALEEAEATGLVDKDGNPIASMGPVVSHLPARPKPHGGKKRKKKKRK